MKHVLSSPYRATACCDKYLDGDTHLLQAACLNTGAFSGTFPLITARVSLSLSRSHLTCTVCNHSHSFEILRTQELTYIHLSLAAFRQAAQFWYFFTNCSFDQSHQIFSHKIFFKADLIGQKTNSFLKNIRLGLSV
ncbi:hypothetical protein J4Q44_G00152330 [Coregonus suidteri]|uniref:Uncharacterized protein n=1 Tax=Coregonus suidteri TaxID=861788 RepID=A0AAN8QRN7_9TELE